MTKEQLAQQSESYVAKNRPTGMSQAEKDKETAIGNLQKKADALNGTSNIPDTGNEGKLKKIKKIVKQKSGWKKPAKDIAKSIAQKSMIKKSNDDSKRLRDETRELRRQERDATRANQLKDAEHKKRKSLMQDAMKRRA